jgi:hypothetical protein
MIKEIYCRNLSDPQFNSQQLETTNAIEALLTKLRMIMFTNRGEILGQPDLGLDLEYHLFELNFNSFQLQQNFLGQIAKYVPEGSFYRIDIEVNFVPGTVRDIAYIDIYIDGTRYLGVVAN